MVLVTNNLDVEVEEFDEFLEFHLVEYTFMIIGLELESKVNDHLQRLYWHFRHMIEFYLFI